MFGLGCGGSGSIFFRKLAVTICLFWSGFRQTAPHPYPHYSNIWAYQGQVIGWICCISCVEDMCNMGPLKTPIC